MSQSVLPASLHRAAISWGWIDAIHSARARDVLRKSEIHRHLPRTGLLLDLGAGLGHIAEAILRDAPNRACVMMDPVSPLGPRVAERLKPYAAHAIQASGTHLPFPDATFDAGWTAFVLHHVPFEGQQVILGEIFRVLRPGAPFVLLEDTPDNVQEAELTLRADRRLNFEPDEAPHHYRSPKEWRSDLPQHGFIVDKEIPFTRVFPPATFHAVQHRAFIYRRK